MEPGIEWLTLAEVSSRAGLSEAEASRQIEALEEYMGGRNFGDIVKYPPQTAELMSAVSNLYRLDWDTGDIAELLQATFQEVSAVISPRELDRNKASLEVLKALFERLEQYHRGLKTMEGSVQQLVTLAGEMAGLLKAGKG